MNREEHQTSDIPSRPPRLERRVPVVTSAGNGRATSLALAYEAAAVVCSDLQPNRLVHGFENADSLPTMRRSRRVAARPRCGEPT